MLLRRLRRSACLFVLVVGSGFTLSAAGQSASAAAAGPTRITFADNRVIIGNQQLDFHDAPLMDDL